MVAHRGTDTLVQAPSRQADYEADDLPHEVGAVLHDPVFWAYQELIQFAGRVVDGLSTWFNSCSCHPRKHIMQSCCNIRSGPCPMVGRHAPAMCNGAWRRVLKELWSDATGYLLTCTQSLSAENRSTLMTDWSAAQSALSLTLELKFSYWNALPWAIVGVADVDHVAARKAAAACVAMYDVSRRAGQEHHPLTVWVLGSTSPLRAEVLQFVRGAALGKLPALERQLLFCCCLFL